jgi:hypothetical protein
LLVGLIFGFWGHDKSCESNHFLEQRRMMMTTTPTSTCNKTMKVKRPREGGNCVIKLFCVGGFFFFHLHFYQAQKKIYRQEFGCYLQIKHNRRLPQIERFYHSFGFS